MDTSILRAVGRSVMNCRPPKGYREKTLTRNTVINGTQFPAGSKVVFNTRGRLVSAWLKTGKIVRIGSFRCIGTPINAGDVLFHDNGSLARCVLAPGKYIVHGITIMDELIWLHENGRIERGSLAHNQIIGGIQCSGSNRRGGSMNMNEFVLFKNGNVSECTLSHDQTFPRLGVKCAKENDIYFHPNGVLGGCYISAHQYIQNVKCGRGNVRFSANGKLERCKTISREIKDE